AAGGSARGVKPSAHRGACDRRHQQADRGRLWHGGNARATWCEWKMRLPDDEVGAIHVAIAIAIRRDGADREWKLSLPSDKVRAAHVAVEVEVAELSCTLNRNQLSCQRENTLERAVVIAVDRNVDVDGNRQ